MSKPPNPGSPDAKEAGCKCPVLDNGHGRGYYGQPDVFVISFDCEMHRGDALSPEESE